MANRTCAVADAAVSTLRAFNLSRAVAAAGAADGRCKPNRNIRRNYSENGRCYRPFCRRFSARGVGRGISFSPLYSPALSVHFLYLSNMYANISVSPLPCRVPCSVSRCRITLCFMFLSCFVLRLGRQRQVWFILLADERGLCI